VSPLHAIAHDRKTKAGGEILSGVRDIRKHPAASGFDCFCNSTVTITAEPGRRILALFSNYSPDRRGVGWPLFAEPFLDGIKQVTQAGARNQPQTSRLNFLLVVVMKKLGRSPWGDPASIRKSYVSVRFGWSLSACTSTRRSGRRSNPSPRNWIARPKSSVAGCARRSAMRGSVRALTASERERLKALERENRELKRANDILRKASAFFAQAELDRRWK
jgi:hypothetical protein